RPSDVEIGLYADRNTCEWSEWLASGAASVQVQSCHACSVVEQIHNGIHVRIDGVDALQVCFNNFNRADLPTTNHLTQIGGGLAPQLHMHPGTGSPVVSDAWPAAVRVRAAVAGTRQPPPLPDPSPLPCRQKPRSPSQFRSSMPAARARTCRQTPRAERPPC